MSVLWIFGYGSLIWDPGFPVAEQVIGTVHGFRRSFCMRSIHHRGTETVPGLVLALDMAEGGTCQGVALRVTSGAETETLEYLRARELVSAAYKEATCAVSLSDGRDVEATTFVIDREHPQYVRDLSLEDQAVIIAQSVGGRGPNSEYLWNTAAHLEALGIGDADLSWLSTRVKTILQ